MITTNIHNFGTFDQNQRKLVDEKKEVRIFFLIFFCQKNAGGAKGMTKLYEKSW